MIAFCPGCRAGELMDPLTEYTERCAEHPVPPLPGLDDALVVGDPMWSPYVTAEAESEQNRAFCRILHRPE